MKNQFVGDINDYYKYGLLRILSDSGKKKIGVCWMLTPERTAYLDDSSNWCDLDPVLFANLRCIVQARSVRRIQEAGILPEALFYEVPFKQGLRYREAYFDEMLRKFSDVDLIFFDPDVGLAPSASKRGGKWLQFSELRRTFEDGHSVFVIQFPLFEKGWVSRQVKQIQDATREGKVFVFRTPTVVFYLVAQQKDVDFFRLQAQEVKKRWKSRIAVTPDRDLN